MSCMNSDDFGAENIIRQKNRRKMPSGLVGQGRDPFWNVVLTGIHDLPDKGSHLLLVKETEAGFVPVLP
jgi:hypothetical protein